MMKNKNKVLPYTLEASFQTGELILKLKKKNKELSRIIKQKYSEDIFQSIKL